VADINRRVADVGTSVSEIHETLTELTRELGAYATTATEANTYVGVETRRLQQALDALRLNIDEHEERTFARIDERSDEDYVERMNRSADAPLDQLDGAVANLVNRAAGHEGFAAQAGLWFNPPVTVELSEGTGRIAGVNERIVEMPYAFGALARLKPPARILEIGSAESTFSLAVASLGYQVTSVDLHPLPYTHPNLATVVGRFEDWESEGQQFDAAFAISTVEHIGLGAYGEPVVGKSADRGAIERVRRLLADDGFMVLTTPYGEAGVTALERTYDDETLADLLAGWTVIDRRVVARVDGLTWTPIGTGVGAAQDEEPAVVMLIAEPATPV